jgi:hypothetical protein
MWQGLARRYASQPIARSIRHLPYGWLIRPLDKTTKGFCEDAWSNFRKPGRDLGTAPTALPAVYPLIDIHRKFTGSRYIAFPMNLAMSLLIGILSVATATMWFVAFALWLRSSAGRSTPEPQHHRADDQRALT